MRWLFGTLIILVIAVMIGLFAYEDSGYVLIARGYRTMEMTLTLFIILATTGFVLGYIAVRIIINSWNMPVAFKAWRVRQRSTRARRDTNRGLVELAQGNWVQAERYLIRNARNSDIPLLNYLSAARAAQKQNAPERRDEYLSLAHKSMKGAAFAVQLTQAELQLVHGQLEQSLATLVHLHASSPKHPHVLFLLAKIYELLRSWGDLKAILPDLKKQKVLDASALEQLERTIHCELLTIATQKGKLEDLRGAWQHVPKALRHDISMVRHYARCLMILEAYNDVETLLRDAIKRNWDIDLVYLYGLLETSDPDKQLATAESWLRGHESNPVLLLTLGRLCVRNKLWGKARSYLDASIHIQPRSDSFKELGQLLEQLEEHEEAAEFFRKGLLLAAEEKMDDMLTVVPARQPVLHAKI